MEGASEYIFLKIRIFSLYSTHSVEYNEPETLVRITAKIQEAYKLTAAVNKGKEDKTWEKSEKNSKRKQGSNRIR